MANREIVDINQQVDTLFTKGTLRNALIICLTAGTFIGFLSPFGMDEIPMYWSMFYWIITCIIGYVIYLPTIFYGNRWLTKILPIHWCRIALCAFVASIVMSFVVPIITWLIFSTEIHLAEQFWDVFSKAIVIGGVLTFASLLQDYLTAQKEELAAQKMLNEEQQQHATKLINQDVEDFMALLPIDKRGELICLEMEDHYLKVYTDKGHHLLLMRFSDALTKLAQYPGLQTHRSWWVALSAITAMNKEGRKTTLSLINNLEVPISRTYAESVKAANIH